MSLNRRRRVDLGRSRRCGRASRTAAPLAASLALVSCFGHGDPPSLRVQTQYCVEGERGASDSRTLARGSRLFVRLVEHHFPKQAGDTIDHGVGAYVILDIPSSHAIGPLQVPAAGEIHVRHQAPREQYLATGTLVILPSPTGFRIVSGKLEGHWIATDSQSSEAATGWTSIAWNLAGVVLVVDPTLECDPWFHDEPFVLNELRTSWPRCPSPVNRLLKESADVDRVE